MRWIFPVGFWLGALLSQPARAQTTPPPVPSTPAALTPPVATVAPRAPTVPLSLAQALARFQRENLRLAAAKYEIGAARADIIAAGLLPNPALELGAGFQLHGDADGARRQFQVMVTQGLPLWGRLGAARDAAELTASATEREFAAVAWQAMGDVRRAYLALQLATSRHAALDAGLADLERVQRVLDARAAAGANPAYDRVRLEVERGALRARIARVRSAMIQAGAGLAAAIGGSPTPGELAAGDALLEPAVDARALDGLVRNALARRHEVAASRLATSAAEARVRATKKRFIPEPEVGLGYANNSNIAGLGSGSMGGMLLASASIPVPVFDHGQGTVDRQQQLYGAARLRERDVANTIEREVTLAARELEASTEAYLAFRREALDQVESVRRIAEVTYREGRGTILELLDAYSSYLGAMEQALELRGAALEAGIELTQALGPR
jgi:cobalt-zinc-cadmium efflux system outer membrane protein